MSFTEEQLNTLRIANSLLRPYDEDELTFEKWLILVESVYDLCYLSNKHLVVGISLLLRGLPLDNLLTFKMQNPDIDFSFKEIKYICNGDFHYVIDQHQVPDDYYLSYDP